MSRGASLAGDRVSKPATAAAVGGGAALSPRVFSGSPPGAWGAERWNLLSVDDDDFRGNGTVSLSNISNHPLALSISPQFTRAEDDARKGI